MIDEKKLAELRKRAFEDFHTFKDIDRWAKDLLKLFPEIAETLEALLKVARQFEEEHRTHFGSGSIESDHCPGCEAFNALHDSAKEK